MDLVFRDRRDAGQRLARELTRFRSKSNLIVLALPRGGVPVGYEVAQGLHAPLDIFVVRKLGVPGHRELAMGAIATGGMRVINQDVVRALDISPLLIDSVAAQEEIELKRQENAFRPAMPPLDVSGRTVILVDDGLATGSTMRAAVRALRHLQPEQIIVAVPVGARATCGELSREADQVVCLDTPEPFHAVGLWYENFDQTTDEEVRACLRSAATSSA